jgi:hypothetical protein
VIADVILSQRKKLKSSPSPVQSEARTAISIPEQIKQLGTLRDSGLVTAEEFETKKRELLSRM